MMTPTNTTPLLPFSPYGTFTGTLFQYSSFPSLTAFETSPSSPNKCVVIGGLGDSLIPTPYTQDLLRVCTELNELVDLDSGNTATIDTKTAAVSSTGDDDGATTGGATNINKGGKKKWSLVQPIMSSSMLGFGNGSLQRDTSELSLLITYLRHHHNCQNIVIVGHSTGCQNIVHLLKYGESEEVIRHIKGVVLQAPVSDREASTVDDNSDNGGHGGDSSVQQYIRHARKLQEQGEEDAMMPRSAFWAPITAYRYLSLHERCGDDDYFSSDYTDEEMVQRLKHVGQCGIFFDLVALVVFSKEDEYVPSSIDEDLLLERLCRAMNVECGSERTTARPLMLTNSNHNLSNDEDDRAKFADAVREMMSSI